MKNNSFQQGFSMIDCRFLAAGLFFFIFCEISAAAPKPNYNPNFSCQTALAPDVSFRTDTKFLNGILAKTLSGHYVLGTTGQIYAHSNIYKKLIERSDISEILWVGELEVATSDQDSRFPFVILRANETAGLVAQYLSNSDAFAISLEKSAVKNLKSITAGSALVERNTQFIPFSEANQHLDAANGGSASKFRHDFINELVGLEQVFRFGDKEFINLALSRIRVYETHLKNLHLQDEKSKDLVRNLARLRVLASSNAKGREDKSHQLVQAISGAMFDPEILVLQIR